MGIIEGARGWINSGFYGPHGRQVTEWRLGIFVTVFRYGRSACVERQLGVIPGRDATDADTDRGGKTADVAYTYSFSVHRSSQT